MKLWYINIWLSPETGYDDDYRYEFTLHTRFISNYFSRQMRRLENRFETDGTFKMISVKPTPENPRPCRIVPEAALIVEVPFSKTKYEQIKGTENFEYYLELLKTGFEKASKCKEIPLNPLLQILDEFKKNGCKNEWLHKKKRFLEKDIEVRLNCFFTTFDFRLVATITKISTKEILCSGTVLRTEPDEIIFDWMFKDILINDKNIVITNSFDLPQILINLKDALKKKLLFKLLEDKEIDRLLSYSN